MVFSNNLLLGAVSAAAGDYLIEQSLLFNDNDSAFLNRTPSTAGNRKTWTFSCWVKPSDTSSGGTIFSAGNSANGDWTSIQYGGSGYIIAFGYDGAAFTWRRATGALFRDLSAWYHVVLS